MLVQIHWQNRSNLKETQLVAQGEFDDAKLIMGWAEEIMKRRRAEMPDGYCPMMCTEDSEYFVLAPAVRG